MKCKSVNKTQTPPPHAIDDFHPAPVFKNIVSPLVSQSELGNSKATGGRGQCVDASQPIADRSEPLPVQVAAHPPARCRGLNGPKHKSNC